MWPALVSTKFFMSVCRTSLDMGSVLRYGERPYCSPRAEPTRQVTLTESANTHRVVPPPPQKKQPPNSGLFHLVPLAIRLRELLCFFLVSFKSLWLLNNEELGLATEEAPKLITGLE